MTLDTVLDRIDTDLDTALDRFRLLDPVGKSGPQGGGVLVQDPVVQQRGISRRGTGILHPELADKQVAVRRLDRLRPCLPSGPARDVQTP